MDKVDAVVLAGGYATRLWPITRNRAKPLLPLAGDVLVDGVMDEVESAPGIEDVYVSTNERFASDFKAYLDERGSDASLVVEPTTSEDEKLGTLGALGDLVETTGLERDTVVIAGDNLFSFDVTELLEFYSERRATCVAAYDVGSREDARDYGLVELDGTEVLGFQEKPEQPKSTLVATACYVFPFEVLDILDVYLSDDNNPDAPGYFLEWLHSRREIHAFVFDGAWFDVGTPESYLAATDHVLGGEPLVEDGADVSGDVVGSSYVADGAVVDGSRLKDSVVLGDAVVRDSSLTSTVVDRQAVVEDLDVSEGLVGAHSEIRSG
ncbi:MAG: NDP-sugar synthase [Halobacteriales archaeon]